MSIHNFVEHDIRGFDIPEHLSVEDQEKLCPGPFRIHRISWTDSNGHKHTFDSTNLYARVLPDRSGIIFLERPDSTGAHQIRQHCGAIILNEDGSERCRLEVPIELIQKDVSPTTSRYFAWIEQSASNFGVTAIIDDAGEFYFELDYNSCRFLWGRAIRF